MNKEARSLPEGKTSGPPDHRKLAVAIVQEMWPDMVSSSMREATTPDISRHLSERRDKSKG